MTAEQRSALMSRIRGKDTGPEKAMRQILEGMDLMVQEQVRSLPGRPDFILPVPKIAILVDGDFWHGWRFDDWKHKLSPKWRDKITANIRRDLKNRRLLRADGWTVIRVWEHQLERSPKTVRRRIRDNVLRARSNVSLAQPDEAVIEQR